MLILLLQQNQQLGGSLVNVPDVVGQTQADGTTSLTGAGFAVSVATAYSNVVAVGNIISQSPTGGSSAASGSTVTITVSLGDQPASSTTAAGGSRKRRRYFVEIDGQDFEVSNPDEAAVLLARAREVAVETIEKARAAPLRINQGIQRPRINTKSAELKPLVRQARKEILSLYDEAIRDLEIRALMAAADEEEEAIVRLLM